MTPLEDRLGSAAQDLRGELDQIDTPTFKPTRSSAPLAVFLVLLLGLGAAGFATFAGRTELDRAGTVSVATQPEVPQAPLAEEPADPLEIVVEEPPVTNAGPSTRQITAAADGEYFVPIPGADAWSRDESWLLLYRTGSTGAAHVVVDPENPGLDPVVLPISPPDIEQVYWHPSEDDLVVYVDMNSIFTFNVATLESTLVHQFGECESVDSGVLPVPIAADGSFSLLCYLGDEVTQVVYELDTGAERAALTSSDTAAFPSPTGEFFVQWNDDDSASVLGRDLQPTGVQLDLESNLFVFVTDSAGNEWVATTLFDGPAIGTLVLLRLDGSVQPVVVIGPDRGDQYPPSGNLLSGAGSRVAVSTLGPDDGAIAGRITVVDLAQLDLTPGSLEPVPRFTTAHRSDAVVDFWSNPFVSLSPSGSAIVYSTDQGSPSIDTFVTSIGVLTD